MLLSKLTWLAYKSFASSPIQELENFPAFSPAEQKENLSRRLLGQIKYFGSRPDALPEWRECARIKEPADLWKQWSSLPIVTKSTLNTLFDPEEMRRRFGLKGRINSTGGSTGEPTRFFLDNAALRASRGGHLFSRLKMGWHPGMPTIIVWGSDRDIGKNMGRKQLLAHKLYRDRLIPGYSIDSQTATRVMNIVRADSPVAMYGFSSLLEAVARRAIDDGFHAPPNSVATAWNGGEMLYDHQIALFKKAFGVPVLNRYGGRELSVTAFQEAEGSPLRLLRPWVFAEVVDETGAPAQPGITGRLILTSTVNRGTPFIRYDVGDLATYAIGDCDESGIRNLRELHGRHAGSLRLQDGRIISCLYWNHLMKDFTEVEQFQVRVKTDGRLDILLKGREFTTQRAGELRRALNNLLRDQPVKLIWTDDIPRTTQGKLVHVVHEP